MKVFHGFFDLVSIDVTCFKFFVPFVRVMYVKGGVFSSYDFTV